MGGIPAAPPRPKIYSRYIVQGLQQGFRVGIRGNPPGRTARNLGSAKEHAEKVDRYLAREVHLQRVVQLSPAKALKLPALSI